MHPLTSSASTALKRIEHELASDGDAQSYICRLGFMEDCGQEKTVKLLAAARGQSQNYAKDLSELYSISYESMKATRNDPSHCLLWRSLYGDSALVWSLLDILHARESNDNKDELYWKAAVKRLDNAIIIAGAPGQGRLDMILDAIEGIQNEHLPPTPVASQAIIPKEGNTFDPISLPSAALPVPVLSKTPSISAFRTNFRSSPFILRHFASEWPAVSERRWASKAYLQSVAGRGRVVPIEIGRDYRTEDWTQRIIEWDDFLDHLFAGVGANREAEKHEQAPTEVVYLAQHDLFKQFPALREDLIVPDYIYACLPPPEHYPQYRPPGNDEELVMNTWIGPRNTVSPAHVDPFYNFYTQVVGRKTVWLAPPTASCVLSPPLKPHSNGHPVGTTPIAELRTPSDIAPAEGKTSATMLSNTTHLDVFASALELEHEIEFTETVVPVAMSAVLDEGDMLFFPPGWWHAFRSETTSFSVSMWF